MMLFITTSMFATAMIIQDEPTAQIPFLKFALNFVAASLGTLILIAGKHIAAGTWSWGAFWRDNSKPQLFAIAGGVVLIALQYFLPQYEIFVETLIEGEVDLNYDNLILSGAVLAGFFKALFKRKETKEKALANG